VLSLDILPGRIYVAGTEASTAFYGYVEGAAVRGQQVADLILLAATRT
jgi:monoamine oxidase